MTYEIIPLDCRVALPCMVAPKSIHTCVTSPPYFGLRDYGHDLQIGLEQTPEEYVAALVGVFRAVRDVLRDDGTLWLNLGDSYASMKGAACGVDRKQKARRGYARPQDKIMPGYKSKDLIGIPWRVAFALQADGWYLRQDIIWSKPNPMPESVTDRCTKAHEYIFLFSKSPRYYFDAEAIKEPLAAASIPRLQQNVAGQTGTTRHIGKTNGNFKAQGDLTTGLRNRRSVWTVTTKPYKGAHFATFPPDLIEPCILAGAPARCCAACGAPHVARRERTDQVDPLYEGSTFDKGKTGARDGGDRTQSGERYLTVIAGYDPTCKCDKGVRGGSVLDPFGGSGTTALVGERLGRNSILCEVNPDYVALAHARMVAGK